MKFYYNSKCDIAIDYNQIINLQEDNIDLHFSCMSFPRNGSAIGSYVFSVLDIMRCLRGWELICLPNLSIRELEAIEYEVKSPFLKDMIHAEVNRVYSFISKESCYKLICSNWG